MWFKLCDCTQVNALPSCIDEINLGVITEVDTAIDVYIFREGAERTQKISAVSGNAGEVIIDVTDITEFLSPNFRYLIWVTLENDNTPVNFTIAGAATSSKCIELPFFEVYDIETKEQYTQLPVIPADC